MVCNYVLIWCLLIYSLPFFLQITDQLKGMSQQQLSNGLLTERPNFKQEMTKLIACITTGNLDPLSAPSMEMLEGAPGGSLHTTSAQSFLAKSQHLSTVVHVIQVTADKILYAPF